jgi:uncharacterized membrane protein required for colicin V production
MNWADLLVIAIIIVFGIVGMKKGFVYSVFKLAAFFISIIVSIKLYPVVANFLMKTAIYTNIKASILKNLLHQQISQAPGVNEQAKSVAANTVVNNLSIPGFLKDSLRKTLETKLPSLTSLIDTNKIMNIISEQLAKIVIDVISLLILYILIRIGLIFLRYTLQGFAKLPVFKQMDKLGGFALGSVEGLLTIYILIAVVMLFYTTPQFKGIFEAIDNSIIAKFFYQHNFIVDWMFPK